MQAVLQTKEHWSGLMFLKPFLLDLHLLVPAVSWALLFKCSLSNLG